MPKSTTQVNYRKIYEQHYGPIPKDEKGRSYEIHHIDGNRNNNDISNLIALSVEDHYLVHFKQGDWAACLKMAYKLSLSGEQISELARQASYKRLKEGTHPFQTEYVRMQSRLRVQNGTHNFLDSESQRAKQLKRLNDGTHTWIQPGFASKRELEKVAKGTHPFVGGEESRKINSSRVQNGTHNFLGPAQNQRRIDAGTHNMLVKLVCPHCNKSANGPNYVRWHGDNCRTKN